MDAPQSHVDMQRASRAASQAALRARVGKLGDEPLHVLISGGSAGIGLGFARHFLSQGDEVSILSSRRAEGARGELLREFPGSQVAAHTLDLADCECLARFVDAYPRAVDVLVHSAGTMVENDAPQVAIDRMLRIRSDAASRLAGLLHRQAQQQSVAILVSSLAAFVPLPRQLSVYAESNRRLVALAQQLHSDRVYAFATAPGLVKTAMADAAYGRDHILLRRWGLEVGEMVQQTLSLGMSGAFSRPRTVVPGEINRDILGARDRASQLGFGPLYDSLSIFNANLDDDRIFRGSGAASLFADLCVDWVETGLRILSPERTSAWHRR